MSITVRNPDGSYTTLAGHPAGISAFLAAMERTESINQSSRFKMNQRVRIKDDYYQVLQHFMSCSAYHYGEARMLAKDLAGTEVTVITPDKLSDRDGLEKIYYTVSMDDGGFHVLPEYLLEDL